MTSSEVPPRSAAGNLPHSRSPHARHADIAFDAPVTVLGGPLGQARGPASSYPAEPGGSNHDAPCAGPLGTWVTDPILMAAYFSHTRALRPARPRSCQVSAIPVV